MGGCQQKCVPCSNAAVGAACSGAALRHCPKVTGPGHSGILDFGPAASQLTLSRKRLAAGGVALRPGFIYGSRAVGGMNLHLGWVGAPLKAVRLGVLCVLRMLWGLCSAC